MATTPKVGGEVDSLCSKCKMSLAHTILAMVGTKIARVRCNTCGGDHAYRTGSASAPTPRSSSSAGARASAAQEKLDKVILGFEAQLQDKDLTQAKPYNVRTAFAVGEVMSHPTFGYGIVNAVRGDKVDV